MRILLWSESSRTELRQNEVTEATHISFLSGVLVCPWVQVDEQECKRHLGAIFLLNTPERQRTTTDGGLEEVAEDSVG